MEEKYKCANHPWLSNLYEIREKWCCAYGKDYFSAGVLSSQRSESANHSICKRINKTTSLCDFYSIFGSVVSDWRSQERRDNTDCWDGVPEVSIPCSLLENAAKVYTIEAFKRFDSEFLKAMSYIYKLESTMDHTHCYQVSTPSSDEFPHFVMYDSQTHDCSCTCKRFEECGFLCRHILRIYFSNCVAEVPATYILKRWTKNAKAKEDIPEPARGNVAGAVWKLDMHRKFHKLIVVSADNDIARQIVNDCFSKVRQDVESLLGGIEFSDTESNSVDVIQNPKGKTKKGEKFTRKRSLIDIETRKASGKFKAADTRARKRAAKNVAENVASVPRHMGLRQILMTPEDYGSH